MSRFTLINNCQLSSLKRPKNGCHYGHNDAIIILWLFTQPIALILLSHIFDCSQPDHKWYLTCQRGKTFLINRAPSLDLFNPSFIYFFTTKRFLLLRIEPRVAPMKSALESVAWAGGSAIQLHHGAEGDEGYSSTIGKLLCLCQTPQKYLNVAQACHHSIYSVGLIHGALQ